VVVLLRMSVPDFAALEKERILHVNSVAERVCLGHQPAFLSAQRGQFGKTHGKQVVRVRDKPLLVNAVQQHFGMRRRWFVVGQVVYQQFHSQKYVYAVCGALGFECFVAAQPKVYFVFFRAAGVVPVAQTAVKVVGAHNAVVVQAAVNLCYCVLVGQRAWRTSERVKMHFKFVHVCSSV